MPCVTPRIWGSADLLSIKIQGTYFDKNVISNSYIFILGNALENVHKISSISLEVSDTNTNYMSSTVQTRFPSASQWHNVKYWCYLYILENGNGISIFQDVQVASMFDIMNPFSRFLKKYGCLQCQHVSTDTLSEISLHAFNKWKVCTMFDQDFGPTQNGQNFAKSIFNVHLHQRACLVYPFRSLSGVSNPYRLEF